MAWYDFLNQASTNRRDAGSPRYANARQRLNARAGVPRATGGFLANPILAAYAIPGYGEQKARNVAGVIEGTRGPLNELQYIGGQLLRGRMPYGGNAIGSIPPSANGESYRRAELRLADAARPGGGGGGGGNAGYSVNPSTGRSGIGSPEDRAYQSAKAETAAMVATDPLMQQWSAAQKAKDFATADQLGKQIWQNKYGGTPMGQPGGAVGSFNPLMERTFPGMSRGAGEYTMGPSPLVPQVDPALNPAGSNYVLGEGPRLMNFSDEDVTPEMIKAYQEQLLKQAASR